MSKVNAKIDSYYKKEKHRTIAIVLLVLAPVILIYFWFTFPPMGETQEITGVVVNLTGVPTEQGDKLYMLVKLNNGNQVRVFIPGITFYKKGGSVNLLQVKPKFFGKTIYKFKGYVKI